MKKAVEIKSLSFSYNDNEILKNLSFSIPEGEFFIIIGPNGSGKTTLMKIIAGILKPKKGDLQILDVRCVFDLPDPVANIPGPETTATPVMQLLSATDPD